MPNFAYEKGKQTDFKNSFPEHSQLKIKKSLKKIKKVIVWRCWKTVLSRLSIDRCFSLSGFAFWIKARSALVF